MVQNNNKKLRLTGKQVKGIQALLSTDTREDAAKLTGVARNTLYRWLKTELFVSELNKAKKEMVRQGILKLQQATKDAVKTLLEICRDKKAPASSRVAAAKEILHNTLKSIELEDVEERIKALENKYLKQK